MSASNEWFEYHLTESKGWVLGSEKIDFAGVKEKPIPEDRVLTLIFHERLSSVFSKPQLWYDETYCSSNTELLNALVKKHGSLPEEYRGRHYDK